MTLVLVEIYNYRCNVHILNFRLQITNNTKVLQTTLQTALQTALQTTQRYSKLTIPS